eukprot:TRINITY_DN771_c0_g1_i1.p1 TRINITY_DN771_c0_g1~~TRINITY_DN771_c0_g1_i1.p1  ORF type:complete len:597 (+),score=142.36 TRINITY_DN771_c0_g1_i1:101-1891(+)
MSALSLLNIVSPNYPDDDIKSPMTPSPNAADLFSPRYNINRRNSLPSNGSVSSSLSMSLKPTPKSLKTPTPGAVAKRFGRRLSVPAMVQYPDRRIAYKLPTALLHHIIQFIDFQSAHEITQLELVCRQFKKAMDLKMYPIPRLIWEKLLVKSWGSSAYTRDELACKLNSKHVYERRFLQTYVPVTMANQELLKLSAGITDFEMIEAKSEFEFVVKKLPAQMEKGRIEHWVSTVNTGYALENVSALEEKQVDNPAFNVSLIRGLFSKNESEVRDSVIRYRQMLSVVNANPNIDAVISAKVVPQFIKLLRHCKDNSLKFEVTWVLTNICSGTSQNVAEVVNAGAVPFLVEALYDQSLALDDIFIEQAIWALGNICGDSAAFCDMILDHEPLPVLTERLLATSQLGKLRLSFLRNTCWFLSNCVRSRPRAPFWKVRRIVDVFAKTLAQIKDVDVLCDTLWGVSYICQDTTEMEAKYLFARIDGAMLITMAQHEHVMVCTPAFNAILHLAKANAFTRHELIRSGVMETLVKIAKQRNFTGRVYKMCLDIYRGAVNNADADMEFSNLPEATVAAMSFLEEKYKQRVNEESGIVDLGNLGGQ